MFILVRKNFIFGFNIGNNVVIGKNKENGNLSVGGANCVAKWICR